MRTSSIGHEPSHGCCRGATATSWSPLHTYTTSATRQRWVSSASIRSTGARFVAGRGTFKSNVASACGDTPAACYVHFKAYAEAGGLMSYGADNVAMYRQRLAM